MRNFANALRKRLTYANVTATLALFLAMGGTAYAAATIGSAEILDNSIQSADIKNGAVTSVDAKNGSLQGVDVKDGSLTAADLGVGSVGTSELADGSVNGTKIADGSIALADLAVGARGVNVQPFAVVVPASIGPFGPPLTRVVGDDSLSLLARCGPYVNGTKALLESDTSANWAMARGTSGPFDTYGHGVGDFFGPLDWEVTPSTPQRGWVMLADEGQQAALLVYLGVSVALDESQCAFDGFAITLR